MGGDVGAQIYILDQYALVEIDDAQRVTGMGIAAVNAIPVNRHIGAPCFRDDEQLVDGALESIKHFLCFKCCRIDKEDLGPHLVDSDHAVRIAHGRSLLTLGSHTN